MRDLTVSMGMETDQLAMPEVGGKAANETVSMHARWEVAVALARIHSKHTCQSSTAHDCQWRQLGAVFAKCTLDAFIHGKVQHRSAAEKKANQRKGTEQ